MAAVVSEIKPIEPLSAMKEGAGTVTADMRPLNHTNHIDQSASRPVIAVIGVGYVGVHLVEAFAQCYEVVAFDISEPRIKEVTQKFRDLAVRCTSQAADTAVADVFLIAVPTSLSDDKTINITFLERAVQTISQYARNGSTVVVESSVAVGMTRQLFEPLMKSKNLKVGMSPERVDAGRQFPAFKSIPKIISGIDQPSLESIQKLYQPIFEHIVPVSAVEVAEMTKLYENCQRMVCAAYANEMADACASIGINGWEVSRAAATKPFGYLPFHPGPGVGGHCIPVNPYYLLQTCDMPILQHATESSWRRPAEIAARLARVLKRKRVETTTKQSVSSLATPERVLVVGVAYKRGQNVLHHAPGVGVIQSLMTDHHMYVEFADPLVDQTSIPHVAKLDTQVSWNKAHLETFDGILVTMKQVGLDTDLLDLLDGVVVHDYCPKLS